jgi:ribosome-binding protein aMBF1 (putative translation factor)
MSKSIFTRQQELLQQMLRDARSQAGLTQAELAKRLAHPQSFISKYESGERLLDIVELRHVCRSLGISLVDFVQRWEEQLR